MSIKYIIFGLSMILLILDQKPLVAEKEKLQVEISWSHPKVITLENGLHKKVLDHKEAVHSASLTYFPSFPVIIPNKKITKYTLSEVQFQELTEEEALILDQNPPPHLASRKEIKFQVKVPISYIFIPSVAFDSVAQKFLKIKSFVLEYAFEINAPSNTSARTSGTTSSVLASGKWYKFAVPEKGIYKLTYEQLKKAGVAVDQIDPRTLKVFGNGGGMLPQKNSELRHQDLVENAIIVAGEEDGVFSQNDYILFYGQGADKISYSPASEAFFYEKNVYSDSCYYFITTEGGQGLRIPSVESPGTQFPIVDTFNDYVAHENDAHNILNSGREWYGEQFESKTSYTFNFPVGGITSNSEIKVISSLLSQSLNPSSFSILINDFPVGSTDFPANQEGQYLLSGIEKVDTFSIPSSLVDVNAGLNLKINYEKKSHWGYLNYFIVSFTRELALSNGTIFFRSQSSLQSPAVTYRIKNVREQTKVWDLTDPLMPKNQKYDLSNQIASYGSQSSALKEWVVFNEDDAHAPVFIEEVPNQNLRGEGTFDMVIVTHRNLLSEANRLADFRRGNDQLNVKVVTVQEIYNEFSSGAKDVTAIRDYMRYLYNLDAGAPQLKYLLLFGKGSFDIRNKASGNINLVPLYASRNSLHPIYSYSSDDYYSFLDEDEGEWEETSGGDHLMDLSVGRIPVRNVGEAKTVVDKIIFYTTSKDTFGKWRKDVYFVADDGDLNLHQNDADKLATLVDSSYTDFNVHKIYVDAYPQVRTGTQKKYAPEVNNAIEDAIKSGALIMNYTGHGGMNKWADEDILTIDMISKWDNRRKLPLFVTATCNFGQHDAASDRSAGEQLLLSPTGGAIGLVTSSRPVFSSTNYALNFAFYKFAFEKVDGQYLTLGEIFKETKNNSLKGSVNRNFSLLGDPAMKLAYPHNNIVITSIANQNLSLKTDTLEALSKVRIAGKIINTTKDTLDHFDGYLYATVYDKDKITTTLTSPTMSFKEKNSVIFRGQASVINGAYSFDFIVPKNISYSLGDGKVSLYALDLEKKEDASGSNSKVKVGGSSSSFIPDFTPPQIRMFLNDTTFRNGGITDRNSLFLAQLFDESGISIINSVNQNITLTVNGEKEIILNNFFEAEPDDYQKGWIVYPINDLPLGKNTLKLKVWDAHNNSSEATLEFFVEEDAKLSLANVINFPNPFAEKTMFQIDHNAAGENLEILMEIYSIKGEQIFSFATQINNAPSRINFLEWNGTNNNGSLVKEGTYIYKVMVRSENTGLANQKFKRLVILK